MFIELVYLIERLSRFWLAMVSAAILIVIVITLTLIKLLTAGSHCGSVKIISPLSGATISESVKVLVEADRPACISSISYKVAGIQFAEPETDIFETNLDPRVISEKFPDLTDGDYELSISIETESGRSEAVADSVQVNIEFPNLGAEVSLEDIREMAEKLATRINQRGEIFVFDEKFLIQIRTATMNYRTDMFTGAENIGAQIRRTSNSVGIPSQLMFLLAASRSRCRMDQTVGGCGVDPGGAGTFKVPPSIMNQFGERSPAVNHELVTQVAARHLKELIQGQRDDFLYAIACFGEPSARIGDIFQRNDQQARRNFYDLVKRGEIRPEESKRVVCFFAAGIVAENPDKFGIKTRSFVDVY